MVVQAWRWDGAAVQKMYKNAKKNKKTQVDPMERLATGSTCTRRPCAAQPCAALLQASPLARPLGLPPSVPAPQRPSAHRGSAQGW